MADYAIVVMVAAGRHCGGTRVSAGAIALETGLPGPTVQKLVSRLTTAGLLRSARGAGGGLNLARPAAAISVADIVEAVEGPIALTACVEHGKQGCTVGHHCAVKPYWPAVNDALRGALASVTLVDLSKGAAPRTPTPTPMLAPSIHSDLALAGALEA
jgi:FeS assembly SUF system regulator